MKNLLTCLLFIGVIGIISAQNSVQKTKYCDHVSKLIKNQNPFYAFDETSLKSEETMVDYNTHAQKLKISGTVFQSDGVTPATDVIIFIQQADENGEYSVVSNSETNYVKNRLWVKTDKNGQYTINTFIPGSTTKPLIYPHELQPMHIHAMIKEPGKQEYAMHRMLFDNDPLVTKSCRKRLKRKNIDSILELKAEDDLQMVTKNIVLESTSTNENI
ncbi:MULTISPECIES: dioxygenase family protein [Bizionia]|uniref:Intradiol ring-cleavage dioxygenases domain-containing protein n=1 Tax=Bizionia algoritergicola TaxID=291187 RepID=A0A5D0QY30_9FLAO|nr:MULTISPECIES: hypothetical protein [Bizionia]OBX24107.1 hypothetical protein BAA08_01865 [Bizionia sp. APA-3]TYB73616.1 hypothetical protein ES675_08155 [Bizionia algoritergicola]